MDVARHLVFTLVFWSILKHDGKKLQTRLRPLVKLSSSPNQVNTDNTFYNAHVNDRFECTQLDKSFSRYVKAKIDSLILTCKQ